jgi:hypothetical protein
MAQASTAGSSGTGSVSRIQQGCNAVPRPRETGRTSKLAIAENQESVPDAAGSSCGPGTSGRAVGCQSGPSSRRLNEAIIMRIISPCCDAVMNRAEKDLPSRLRITANRTGAPGRPGRMK